VSDVNRPYLKNILQTLLDGCYFFNDPAVQRLTFTALKHMIATWAGPQSMIPGFSEFIFTDVSKSLFAVPLDSNFNLADATSDSVLSEIVNIQKVLLDKYGQQYADFLTNTVLPSLKCNNGIIQQYIVALKQQDQTFKKWLRDFLGNQKSTAKK